MADEKFVWCRACDETHHVTPYDKAPSFGGDLADPGELPIDDWRVFAQRHADHRLEALRAPDRSSWEGGNIDPMQQRFIEVTNGREWFVIRGFRTSIHEPVRFDVAPGRLRTKWVALEVQEDAIREELKLRFPWTVNPPSDEKIELFIALFRQLARGLAPDRIGPVRRDYREAAVAYGALTEDMIDNLFQQCARYFLPEELKDLRRFLEAQREHDGVMALRVRQEYAIEKPADFFSGPRRL